MNDDRRTGACQLMLAGSTTTTTTSGFAKHHLPDLQVPSFIYVVKERLSGSWACRLDDRYHERAEACFQRVIFAQVGGQTCKHGLARADPLLFSVARGNLGGGRNRTKIDEACDP
jgi:hypothetical protein